MVNNIHLILNIAGWIGEEYLKYKTFTELNSRFNLPLEGNNYKENKDFDDKRELINSLVPIQE